MDEKDVKGQPRKLLGATGQGYAGDLLEVLEELDLAPPGQERGDTVLLAVADLQGEEAAGLYVRTGLWEEAFVDFEAGGACEKCGGGLVIADLGVEGGGFRVGNVGWVGDDGVALCAVLDA
jgi:hypothetical protein